MCAPVVHDGVRIAMTECTPCELWMLNDGKCALEVGPGELFGFNVGSFNQKPQGAWCETTLTSFT